jgi:hypothetical protein
MHLNNIQRNVAANYSYHCLTVVHVFYTWKIELDKKISMVLQEGLSTAIKGEIYSEITSEQARVYKYLSEDTIVCNCIIWGSEIRQRTIY